MYRRAFARCDCCGRDGLPGTHTVQRWILISCCTSRTSPGTGKGVGVERSSW
jgi:hypothetical protein